MQASRPAFVGYYVEHCKYSANIRNGKEKAELLNK